MAELNHKKLNHNQETEASILGGIILDPSIIDQLRLIIKPQYFSVITWGKVYQIMLKIAETGIIDPIILRHELEKEKIDYGGTEAISDWSSIAYTTSDTLHHARRLVTQWQCRQLEKLLYSSLDNLQQTESVDEICQIITEEITNLSIAGSREIPTAREIIALNRAENNLPPVTTGYQALDDYFGDGLDRGSVTIIAGGTSIGKSQLAINITKRATSKGIRCLYIVQEMSQQVMEDRFVAIISGVPQKACKKLQLEKAKQSTVERYIEDNNKALDEFASLPLRIQAKGTITAREFEKFVMQYHRQLDLVVLDYMQQCRASYSNQESRKRVDEISRMCKHLAAKYNIAIIALAQISREGSKASMNSNNGRPQLHHLKESSSIEQDTDNVILLHRERRKYAETEVLELDISKSRNGETGQLYFTFELETGIIYDPQKFEAAKPLADHLADYQTSMAARQCNSRHIAQEINKLKRTFKSCRFYTASNFDANILHRFLVDLTTGKNSKSPRTANNYLICIKAFCNWLCRLDVLPENPFKSLQKFSESNDIRRVRRALTAEEFSRLITATRTGDSFLDISGEEWALLFLTAAETGFRWNELRSLKRGQFTDLDTDTTSLSISAADTKNGKAYTQPLRIKTAELLYNFLKMKLPTAAAFTLPKYDKGAEAIQHYLTLTGDENNAPIPYKDAADRIFDFHALRGQFATSLARSGVSLAAARELMRHSTVDLTAKHYTHYSLEDRRAALNKLPHYNRFQHNSAKRTGTDNTGNTAGNTLKITARKTDQILPNSADSRIYQTNTTEDISTENPDATIDATPVYTKTKALYTQGIQGFMTWHSQGD